MPRVGRVARLLQLVDRPAPVPAAPKINIHKSRSPEKDWPFQVGQPAGARRADGANRGFALGWLLLRMRFVLPFQSL